MYKLFTKVKRTRGTKTRQEMKEHDDVGVRKTSCLTYLLVRVKCASHSLLRSRVTLAQSGQWRKHVCPLEAAKCKRRMNESERGEKNSDEKTG